MRLHAWLTVAMLSERRRPSKPDKSIPRLQVSEMRELMSQILEINNQTGDRIIIDTNGNNVHLDNRMIDKMIADEYKQRLPYLAWVPSAPQRR